jgi:hypothetical protein
LNINKGEKNNQELTKFPIKIMEEKLESPSKYLVNKIRLKTLNTFMHTLIILEQINIKVFKEIKVVK